MKITDYADLANRILDGAETSRTEAEAIIEAPEDDLLPILDAAFRIRRTYFGRKVQIHQLVNAKSGLCPEDCNYCSQSSLSTAEIEKYNLIDEKALVEGAKRAVEANSRRYCIVLSGRGPTDSEIEHIGSAIKRIKSKFNLSICCSLGIFGEKKAQRLQQIGVDRLNHNLNTSERFYPEICTTHTYEDRMSTLQAARSVGMELCSGVIFGQGETNGDIIDMCGALRVIQPESIPVNFLHAIPGTPFQGRQKLNPTRCLRLLSLMRFFNPKSEIRVAGGRELQFGLLQGLALYPANSVFVSGYLTTSGQTSEEAHRMIHEMGFTVDETGESDSHPQKSMDHPYKPG